MSHEGPGLDELIEHFGINMTVGQYDFFNHPANDEFAVVVYGVPDPDRLYIAGPDEPGTIYQLAQPGEPADARGLSACLLPVVVRGADQEDACSWINSNDDCSSEFAVLHVQPVNNDWMMRWAEEEYPITVAPWDLWPIEAHQIDLWDRAGRVAYESSMLEGYYELLNVYNYGVDDPHEVYGEEWVGLNEELALLELDLAEIKSMSETDPISLQRIRNEIRGLKDAQAQIEGQWLQDLESSINHPATGQPDPQMPAPELPPDEAAIWSSLLRLSWRNWVRLSKSDLTGSGAPDRRRFIEANRRLSPWY